MGRFDTYIGNWGGVRLLGGGRPGVPLLRSADPYRSGFRPLIRPLRGHLPPEGKVYGAHTVRPYGLFTNASTHKKRDRSGTCPLKHRGETKFRTKFLCFLSFSKKGSYTGPWRKRSIISWVREMADPPWGRFSRSNQVPSPSSSSWRVTVSSSVSRSQ